MAFNVSILEAFRPLLEPPGRYNYIVYSSGRGCGKSYGIGQALVIRAALNKIRILCIREVQKSLNESVKALIESLIVEMNLSSLFTIRHDSIECVNGSKFLFMGMRDANAINVKSIADIDITWIEEAEAFSKRSWELLVPSVMRTASPQIVISFNPRFEDDIIYQTFFVRKPPPKSLIVKLKPEDNPFFKTSNLEVQRQHDYETLPESEYRHKWLGELIRLSENSLFNARDVELSINSMRPDLNDFSRIVIACDPATTHKEHSNEYGISVCGLHKNGEFWMLENASKLHNPSSFANEVDALYWAYKADTVVVETNQGGDFIKHTILQKNPRIKVSEVRASRDKVHRASPVASMFSLSKIKIYMNENSDKAKQLIRQMSNLTTQGYIGPKGASPDALDAFVWGIYELANLSERDTENTLFNPNKFKMLEGYNFVPSKPSLFVCSNAIESVCIEFEMRENSNTERILVCTDCFVCETSKLQSEIEPNKYESIWLPEREMFYKLDWVNYIFYDDAYKEDLDHLALETYERAHSGLVRMMGMPSRSHKDVNGELLKIALIRFKLEQKQECLFTKTFCFLVENLL